MSDDFAQRVIRCIAQSQRIPVESVQLSSTFEELKIDSLDGINILFALENEFGVNIPDEAAKDIKTVGDLATGLHGMIESGAAGSHGPRPSPPDPAGQTGSAA